LLENECNVVKSSKLETASLAPALNYGNRFGRD
jgi:hypothetical protein